MERKYFILNTYEVTQGIIDVCLQTSLDTLRKTKDGSKSILKFEGNTPEILKNETLYNYEEIKEELKKDEWYLTT